MKCLGIAPGKKIPCNFIESFRQCVMNFKQNNKQLQIERTKMLWIKRLLISDLSNDVLVQLLLYVDQELSYDLNRKILELTLRYIHETGRFD